MGVEENHPDLLTEVMRELDNIQPYVQSHQGEIELIAVQEYNVIVRLKGACDTCPLSFYTITFGLEQRLQKLICKNIRVIIQD